MNLFNKKSKNSLKIVAAHDGEVHTLATLKDGVFSKKMLGNGIVIKADQKVKIIDILSPVSGKLLTAFPTGHAFGIRTKDGKEILVHIGVDTVNLEGKGFDVHVTQDQNVKVGDKLVTVDLEFIRKNAPSASTIIIVTSGQKIQQISFGLIKAQETLFKIL